MTDNTETSEVKVMTIDEAKKGGLSITDMELAGRYIDIFRSVWMLADNAGSSDKSAFTSACMNSLVQVALTAKDGDKLIDQMGLSLKAAYTMTQEQIKIQKDQELMAAASLGQIFNR